MDEKDNGNENLELAKIYLADMEAQLDAQSVGQLAALIAIAERLDRLCNMLHNLIRVGETGDCSLAVEANNHF